MTNPPPPSFSSFPTPPSTHEQSNINTRENKSHTPRSPPHTPPDPTWAADQLRRAKKRKRKEEKAKSRKDESEKREYAPSLIDFDLEEPLPKRLKATDAFPIVIHAQPDHNNLRYGSLHAGDLSRFSRSGQGRVLGLHPSLRIVRSQQGSHRDIAVLPRSQHRLARYTDKNSSWRILRNDVKLQTIYPEERATHIRPDVFIGLLEEDLIESDVERSAIDPDYRDLGEARRLHSPSASGSDHEDEPIDDFPDSSKGVTTAERIAQRNTELSALCQREPWKPENWLAFVHFQDEYLASSRASFQSGRTLGENEERRAIADGKLSILDKAIEVNKRSSGVLDLVKERLRFGEIVWTRSEIQQEWKRALKKYASDDRYDQNLLVDFLLWRKRDGGSFKIRTDYLPQVSKALRAPGLSPLDKVDVFSHSAEVMRQAGYVERSVAMFQAMLELTFHMPSPLRSASFEEQLDDLETFWDSEAPRFGESNAKGWNLTEADAEPPPLRPKKRRNADQNQVSSDVFLKWAMAEMQSAEHRSYPARLSTDEADGDEDDVYRVVLFADIRPLLFSIPESDHRAREMLCYSYLAFNGLPFLPPGISSNDLPGDSYLLGALGKAMPALQTPSPADQPHSFEIIGGEPMTAAPRTKVDSPSLATLTNCFPITPDMFGVGDTSGWPGLSIKAAGQDTLELLEQISKVLPTAHEIKLLWTAAASRLSIKSGIKVAKSLLASNPEDLTLWSAYASLEASRGNSDTARRTFHQIIQQMHRFSEKSRSHSPVLWLAWVEFEVERNENPDALQIIVAAAHSIISNTPHPISAQASRADVIRTRTMLAEYLRVLNPSATQHYECILSIAAYLEYLEHSVDHAKRYFEVYLANLSGVVEEKVRMLMCKMIYRHSLLQSSFKPGDLSDLAEQSLSRFPNNTVFFGALFYSELRTRIRNRVRSTIDSLLKRSPSVLLYLERIFVEHAFDFAASNSASIRHQFDRAVTAFRQSPSFPLWERHLDWVSSDSRNARPGQVRSAFLQAVQECPFAKAIIVKACSSQDASAWRRGELSTMLKTGLERELRFAADPAPFVAIEELDFGDENDDQAQAIGEDGDRGPVDPALFDVSERQRLLPYG